MIDARLMIGALGCLVIAPAFRSIAPPTDPHIRYIGRFDYQNPDGPRCAWSASAVEIAFRGTSAKVKLRESGQDQLQVVVDGEAKQVLKLEKGEATYDLDSDLPFGNHVIKLVKRTEAGIGTIQFLGFDVDGPLSEPRKPRHIIELIGDSISCGYGIEGKSKEEHFKIDTENANMTYGAVVARDLGADFIDVAWSGRKMWPDNTIPELYNLALPDDKTSLWDLHQEVPDVIVINLATNDFGLVSPDEKGWTEAYSAFIQRLRERAPKARIYLAIGPMITDTWPPKVKALTSARHYLTDVVGLRAAVGDDNLRIIEFETQTEERDGIGADWHPNIISHNRMARVLEDAIRSEVKW